MAVFLFCGDFWRNLHFLSFKKNLDTCVSAWCDNGSEASEKWLQEGKEENEETKTKISVVMVESAPRLIRCILLSTCIIYLYICKHIYSSLYSVKCKCKVYQNRLTGWLINWLIDRLVEWCNNISLSYMITFLLCIRNSALKWYGTLKSPTDYCDALSIENSPKLSFIYLVNCRKSRRASHNFSQSMQLICKFVTKPVWLL